MTNRIIVVIPAFNEQGSIKKVIGEIPKSLVDSVVVVDNASTDDTFLAARESGAVVLKESKKGYGSACLRGLQYLAELEIPPKIVVFLDGDYSDYPEEMTNLVQPIIDNQADMIIGSRSLGERERGSMTPQQVFGNWLATRLMRLFYGVTFTDLGPFRAIRYDSLITLGMEDTNYGWTVEMQIKAAKLKLRCQEVPVKYRRRIGVSKISGTLRGTLSAGYKIIYTLIKYR